MDRNQQQAHLNADRVRQRAQLDFLLVHGLAGWCPRASLFRQLGFRTQREIEGERLELMNQLNVTASLGCPAQRGLDAPDFAHAALTGCDRSAALSQWRSHLQP